MDNYRYKITIICISVLVVIFSLIYFSNLNTLKPPEGSDLQSPVEMTIVSGTGDAVTLRLTNNTNYLYLYGAPFILETNDGDEWSVVNFRPSRGIFNLPAFPLYPKSYVYKYIDLSSSFGRLSPGRYRIVKEVGLHDSAREERLVLTAEFMITR